MNWMDDRGIIHCGISMYRSPEHPRIGKTRKSHQIVTCLWCVIEFTKKKKKRRK